MDIELTDKECNELFNIVSVGYTIGNKFANRIKFDTDFAIFSANARKYVANQKKMNCLHSFGPIVAQYGDDRLFKTSIDKGIYHNWINRNSNYLSFFNESV